MHRIKRFHLKVNISDKQLNFFKFKIKWGSISDFSGEDWGDNILVVLER